MIFRAYILRDFYIIGSFIEGRATGKYIQLFERIVFFENFFLGFLKPFKFNEIYG